MGVFHNSNSILSSRVADRARMRQANRLFNGMGSRRSKLDPMTIESEDITASRVLEGVVEGLDRSEPLVD
jgi:hypothetical protein